mgnify:CR=1 FL=1
MKLKPYYIHTDFFSFFLHLSKFKKFSKLNQKDILNVMLKELKNISKNKLIIPTYNYDFGKTQKFDVIKDKSQIGSFSEYFRKKYLNNRSTVPFYSDCSTYSRSKLNHLKINTPLGDHSTFDNLYKEKGKIAFFGSEFSPTYIHYIETKNFDRIIYRFYKKFTGKIKLKKKTKQVTVNMHVVPKKLKIQYDLKKIEKDLLNNKILKLRSSPLKFKYKILDVNKFHIFSSNKIKKNPYYFLTKKSISNVKKIKKR